MYKETYSKLSIEAVAEQLIILLSAMECIRIF
jgi:hypothetical protein